MMHLPVSLESALPAVFGAGLLASLSPCVYPVLPITVGFLSSQASEGRTSRVLAYVFGQTLAFTALGMAAVTLGETLGFSSESSAVRLGVGLLLLGAAWVSYRGSLPGPLGRLTRSSRLGVASGALALGASSALVASPCTSPILGGVLAMMAGTTTLGRGIALMLAYSLGFSVIFLALGLGAVKLPRSGRWLLVSQRAGALLLLASGIYFLLAAAA